MKKVAKRLGSMIMAIMMIAGTVQLPMGVMDVKAAAEPAFTVAVDNHNAKAGDTVTATVSVAAGSEITGLQFGLYYDKNLFEVGNVTPGTVDGLNGTFSAKDGYINYGGLVMSLTPIQSAGTLLTVTFTVKADVADTSTMMLKNIEGTTGADDADFTSDSGCTVDSTNASTTVSVDLKGIGLKETEATLNKGDSKQLEVTYQPAAASVDQTPTWTSNAESVATVDSNGLATAVGAGTAKITAKVGDFTADCTITVQVPLTGITLDKDKMAIEKGEASELVLTFNPDDATSRDVVWTSLDESVATVAKKEVTADGKEHATVTAASKGGKATITATCGDYTATCEVTVLVHLDSIALDSTTMKIAKDEVDGKKLSVIYKPEEVDDDKKVTWESDNTLVATVDATGLVKPVAKGTATITAKVGELTAECVVTVNVPLRSILVTPDSAQILKGKGTKVTALLNPLDPDDTTITWSSSDETIATVKTTGGVTLVTGVKAGTVTITATGAGNVKGNCDITVSEKAIESITLNKTAMTLDPTNKFDLVATILPEDTTDTTTITWESSNPAVATVDENGKVTAVAYGEAVITATTSNKLSATCAITVMNPITGITLDKTEWSLMKDQEYTLVPTILPGNTTDAKTIRWTSSNTAVATVDANGTVKAIADGKTTITATTINGKTATCLLTVQEVKMTDITLSSELEIDVADDAKQLTVEYVPADTTDDRTIDWSSSDKAIATVDKDGNVKGIKPGTATITAKATGANNIQKTCTVTVKARLISIKLTPAKDTLIKGEDTTIATKFNPENTTDSTAVTWSSSDESKATVDENGKVKAISEGDVTITATGANNVQGICTITVKENHISGISLDKESITLDVADSAKLTERLTATLKAQDPSIAITDDTTITWSSSSNAIATVDQNGLVTAVSGGTATITAATSDNKFTATCTVKVLIHTQSIAVTPSTATVLKNETQKLEVSFTPANTDDDKTITWSSSDNEIATVTQNGLVTAVAEGTATITATTKDGKWSNTSVITVTENHLDVVKIEDVDVIPGEANVLPLDNTCTLNAETFAVDIDLPMTDTLTYEWESSDTDVIDIQASKKSRAAVAAKEVDVIAKGIGTADITVNVTSKELGQVFADTITLEVKEVPLKSISISNKDQNATLEVGASSEALKVEYNPTYASGDKTVTWTSSDESVATISEDGVIKAIKAGKTTITAKVQGITSDPFEVTVTAKKTEGGTNSGKKPVDKQDPAKGAVKTGDNYQVFTYAMVLFLAAGVIVCTMIMRKRKTK